MHHGRHSELFPGRTDLQCRSRWKRVLNPELIKGTWTKEEDDLIIQLVEKHGCKWSVIAKSLPGRIGKQCQDRWLNYLNPAINKDAWTREEEEVLVCAHQIYGSKWAEIAKYLPGRTGIFIKSHLKSSVKKRLDSFSESGFIEQPLGAVALDLNSDIQSVECPKGEPLKRYADDFISHDWKLNAGSFNTSNVGLGHQNISPKEQFLDVQSTFTGDSKCLRAGNIHTLPEDSKHLHKVVEPITEDSKCTTPGETNYEPLKSLQQNLSKSGDLALRDVNKKFKGTSISSLQTCKPSDSDGTADITIILTTPQHFDDGNCGSLLHSPLQLMDGDVCLSSEKLSKSKNHIQPTPSPIHCSTTLDLSLSLSCIPSSPEPIVRSAAKSFKRTPVLRKQGHEF
ncbi:transcription factor MYB3R-5-like [Phoenix dactylifera]|uniref:Transcription factor MYB3R-5-like n=1 Tax=Phoenix dactylifera TaxID=42345 RepID=A0A8B8ZXZ8_PHODC|nr:transcription factor MYB3R-5-like [Phoenix dactylifera]